MFFFWWLLSAPEVHHSTTAARYVDASGERGLSAQSAGGFVLKEMEIDLLRGSGYLVTGYMQVYNPRIWGHITHENRGYNPGYNLHVS